MNAKEFLETVFNKSKIMVFISGIVSANFKISLIHSIFYEKQMLNFHSHLTSTALINTEDIFSFHKTIETKNKTCKALVTNATVHSKRFSRLVKNDS